MTKPDEQGPVNKRPGAMLAVLARVRLGRNGCDAELKALEHLGDGHAFKAG